MGYARGNKKNVQVTILFLGFPKGKCDPYLFFLLYLGASSEKLCFIVSYKYFIFLFFFIRFIDTIYLILRLLFHINMDFRKID